MRYLSLILTIPVAVLAVLFAVSNRGIVTFSLWPTPFTVDAPVYLATLVFLVVGFVFGGVITWLGQGRHRRRGRVMADRVAILERDLKDAQVRAATAEKRLAELNKPVSGQPRAAVPAAPAVAAAPAPAALPGSPTVH
ncbi:putative integral membrane protein [Azospirillum fermentarium]|uniref:LapA family protein n=1 Tax=Azospirillum fermentarium TaxID=1233114 RepID=UPI00222737C7|nr:LapA family protein [Azospirillum fermentarium]MCW2245116.1 putative integral membrane protein [Azospirillum fermentarium]